jgi:hypothetical protein
MAVQTVTMRNTLATAYGAAALYGAMATTAPGGSAGTEVTGGSPPYARISSSWGSASSSAITATAQAFNIPSSTTVVGYEAYSASTAGTYLDGCAVTSQAFSSQGVYTITPTYTQA